MVDLFKDKPVWCKRQKSGVIRYDTMQVEKLRNVRDYLGGAGVAYTKNDFDFLCHVRWVRIDAPCEAVMYDNGLVRWGIYKGTVLQYACAGGRVVDFEGSTYEMVCDDICKRLISKGCILEKRSLQVLKNVDFNTEWSIKWDGADGGIRVDI